MDFDGEAWTECGRDDAGQSVHLDNTTAELSGSVSWDSVCTKCAVSNEWDCGTVAAPSALYQTSETVGQWLNQLCSCKAK
jgi:hypothetical protein